MTFDVHTDKIDSLSHHCGDSNFNRLINLWKILIV